MFTKDLLKKYHKDKKVIKKSAILKNYTRDKEGFEFEILVSSWLTGKTPEESFKFIIQENKKGKKVRQGIDIVYLVKNDLFLIQTKNTPSIDNLIQTFIRSRNSANDFFDNLISDDLTLEEKNERFGVNKEILKKINKLNGNVKKHFLFVMNDEKENLPEWDPSWEITEGISQKLWNEEVKGLEGILAINLLYEDNGCKNEVVEHRVTIPQKEEVIQYHFENVRTMIMKLKLKDIMQIILKEEENGNSLDSLFEKNVRNEQNSSVNKEIKNTIENNPSEFFFLNNGLTFIVNDLTISRNDGSKTPRSLSFSNPIVVNGQQTLRSLYILNKKNKISSDSLYILCRFNLIENDEKFIQKIAFATNNQNKIDKKDLLVLFKFQKIISNILANNNIFYEIKKGKADFSKKISLIKNHIHSEDLIKYFFMIKDKEITIKNKPGKFFERLWEYLYLNEANDKVASFYFIKKMENGEFLSIDEEKVIIKMALIHIKLNERWNEIKGTEYAASKNIFYYVIFNLLNDEKWSYQKNLEDNINDCFNKTKDHLINYFEKHKGFQKEKGLAFRSDIYWLELKNIIDEINSKNWSLDKKIKKFNQYLRKNLTQRKSYGKLIKNDLDKNYLKLDNNENISNQY